MHHGNMLPLMFGKMMVLATQLPHKMIVLPNAHYVVNVMKTNEG